jgi:phage terminase Nu1 subunit (DNA packaging protein)
MLFVSGQDLAEVAGVNIRTIQNWAMLGYFQRDGKDRYDLVGYYQWQNFVLTQEIEALKDTASSWDGQWRQARCRKTIAQAKLAEIELKKLSNELVLSDIAKLQLTNVLTIFITKLKRLPREFSKHIAQSSASLCHDLLRDIIDQTLKDISLELQKKELPEYLLQAQEELFQID